MSQDLEILGSLSLEERKTLAKDKLRILKEWMAGKSETDIAIRYGMTPSDVERTIAEVQDDIATMRIDADGFDGQLVSLLIGEFKDLSEKEAEIPAKESLTIEVLSPTSNKVVSLTKEESTRDLIPKYKQVKMQILKHIRELVAVNQVVKDKSPQESLAALVVEAFTNVAQEKGKLEEKLDQSKTVEGFIVEDEEENGSSNT